MARKKDLPGVLSPHHPFFPMFLKPYFSCPLFGRENPRISLNNAFPPSFSAHIYYIMCIKNILLFLLKKLPVCFVILWKVSTFAPANEKQRSLRASSLKDFT